MSKIPENASARKPLVIQFAVSGGGVKRHVLELAAGFDRNRFDMEGVFPDAALSSVVAGDRESRYQAAFARLGLTAHTLEVPRWHSLRGDLRSLVALARLLRRLKPDILHCHSSKAGLIGRLAALFGGRPAVCYTPHAMYYAGQRGLKRAIYLWAERLLAPLAGAIIAVSDSEYRELRRDLRADGRLVRINNGIGSFAKSHDTAAVRREYGLPATEPVMLTPSRCEPQKDVRTLVLAMAEVVKASPGATLAVAGEGSLRPGLERLSADLGLAERVRFLGWIENIEPLLAASDVVILSSRYEGLPYAILEASAMGKPTIGSDVTGTRDCIENGKTGFLLPPGDVEGFAREMAFLCLHPRKREVMGRAGQAMVAEKFGVARMIRELGDLYARLVS
ncbi:MAG: glycosyltransferase family 4 protein [Planctomycetota bacterium]|jgi:glycosyltransferase involved in cell wall biosynthesis|nr:glycosyltransferase family 4 protein [Planctomycetota bacterium]